MDLRLFGGWHVTIFHPGRALVVLSVVAVIAVVWWGRRLMAGA